MDRGKIYNLQDCLIALGDAGEIDDDNRQIIYCFNMSKQEVYLHG